MRFSLLFLLLIAQCHPKENQAQTAILRYFQAHNELRCLLLEADSEHTLFLEIQPRKSSDTAWLLKGQQIIKTKNKIELHTVKGDWRLADASLHLRLFGEQGYAIGEMDLKADAEGWAGSYSHYKKHNDINFRWLGYTQDDSLAFFKQAVQTIAPHLQGKIGESPIDSASWAYAPYYYQYNKDKYDVELYQLPKRFPPTVFALERLPEAAYFSVYQYQNQVWQRCSDTACLPDVNSQYAHRSDILRFANPKQPFLIMRYFGMIGGGGKLRFWKL